MIKVVCTVVTILSTGYKQVSKAEGHMTNEGVKGRQERLLVDFGPNLPSPPRVRWVDENDCIYLDTTHIETDYNNYLIEK